jgi:hypothetical protein
LAKGQILSHGDATTRGGYLLLKGQISVYGQLDPGTPNPNIFVGKNGEIDRQSTNDAGQEIQRDKNETGWKSWQEIADGYEEGD